MSPDKKELTDHYIRKSFKGNKVWAAAGPDGELQVENGKVKIKYQLEQDYEYQVKKENLRPENEAIPKNADKRKTGTQAGNQAVVQIDPDCINVFTDGASSGNPGPAGIGVLFVFREHRREISRYIGRATNNVAELTAILTALQELKRTDLAVRVYTDSTYAIGVLTKNWKPEKNVDLIARIKKELKRFRDVGIIKVKGHSGVKENEVADFLATSAVKQKTG